MQISTKFKTNSNGRSQIVARGFGKQATVSFDSERSVFENHGLAAGELLVRNGATSAMFHPSNTLTADFDGTVQGVFKFKKIL